MNLSLLLREVGRDSLDAYDFVAQKRNYQAALTIILACRVDGNAHCINSEIRGFGSLCDKGLA